MGKNAKHLIIYNQNWADGDDVIRFVDKGLDWYIKHVPHSTEENVRSWFGKHEQINPDTGAKWRDVHYFWQWGIPLSAMTKKLEAIGFTIDLAEKDTLWSSDHRHIRNDKILASKAR